MRDDKNDSKTIASRSGTVGRILNDGQDGKPFRALVHGRGRYFTLISRLPLPVRPGDDITAFGDWQPDLKKPRNGKLIIRDTAPAIYRLRRQIENGAEVRHFGSGDRPRPGQIAAAASGAIVSQAPAREGVSIFEPAESSPDPIINWAVKLFKSKARRGSIHIIDPLAFYRPNRLGRIDRHGAWRSILPRAASTKFAKIFAERAGARGGVAWPFRRIDPLAYQTGFVIPWNPFDTVETGLAKYAGLSHLPYWLNAHDDVGFKRRFTIAHELTHIVQVDQGFFSRRQFSKVRLREINADSFAILAVAQETGRFDLLEKVRDARSISLLTTSMDHWTGPGFATALDLARRLESEGKLKGLDTQAMLNLAAQNARVHWLTKAELTEMKQRRDAVLTAAGYVVKNNFVYDPGGKRDLAAVVRAALADPAQPFGRFASYFAESADALDRVAVPLNKPLAAKAQAEMIAALRADMTATADLLAHSPEGLNRLLASERKRGQRKLAAAEKSGSNPGLWRERLALLEAIGREARANRAYNPASQTPIEPLVTIRRDPPPIRPKRA